MIPPGGLPGPQGNPAAAVSFSPVVSAGSMGGHQQHGGDNAMTAPQAQAVQGRVATILFATL